MNTIKRGPTSVIVPHDAATDGGGGLVAHPVGVARVSASLTDRNRCQHLGLKNTAIGINSMPNIKEKDIRVAVHPY